MANLKEVQTALISKGYDLGPGRADGVLGRKTQDAIILFQKENKLNVKWPGTVGAKTLQALGLSAVVKPETIVPPWISYARTLKGLHEKRDAKNLNTLLRLTAAEIAWCGAFVQLCFTTTLAKETLPTNPLGSRNWLKFGIELLEPKVGAIAVFYRGEKTGWQGHVGFVVGHDKTHLHILGGNQSDSVSIVRVAKDRLLGYRWPVHFGEPNPEKLEYTTITASISTNEA